MWRIRRRNNPVSRTVPNFPNDNCTIVCRGKLGCSCCCGAQKTLRTKHGGQFWSTKKGNFEEQIRRKTPVRTYFKKWHYLSVLQSQYFVTKPIFFHPFAKSTWSYARAQRFCQILIPQLLRCKSFFFILGVHFCFCVLIFSLKL